MSEMSENVNFIVRLNALAAEGKTDPKSALIANSRPFSDHLSTP